MDSGLNINYIINNTEECFYIQEGSLERRVAHVFFPLGDPGIPEVIILDNPPNGTNVVTGMQRRWFMVPPGQDGKLWRVTGGGFLLDPKIPPYFAVIRETWFLPQALSYKK